MSISLDINLTGLNRRFSKQAQRRAQLALAERAMQNANVYCPRDTGALQDSVFIAQDGTEIIWPMSYAKKVYYGSHVKTAKNSRAKTHWFEYAKSKHLKAWTEVAKRALV